MKKKIRILYMVSHPIQYQAPLLRFISESQDMDVTTIFYWDRKSETHFDEGFNQKIIWDVPLLSGYEYIYLNECAASINIIKKISALWKIIHAKQHDIVWTHGYTDIFTISGIFFAKLKGLKIFVRGESMLFIHEKINLKRRFFFKILDKFVDQYLAIGTENKNFYIQNGVSNHKISLCNYTVDNYFFHEKFLRSKETLRALRTSLKLEENRPIILYASKFLHRKHPMDLLDAYTLLSKNAEAPRPYLLFIGTGEDYDAVIAKALEKNWNTIQFLGFKNQSELPDYFALADILVLPSERENWGLVVNEAMNAACAIIVSDQTGCAVDLVRQGENGFIFPARNIKILSNHLNELTTNDALLEKMKTKSLDIISHWGLPESVDGLRKACLCAE